MDLLRHLSFFVTVAEEGHFGHAADRLGITQPPLSQGIRRLERSLGLTLLTRDSRSVGLTTAGAALLPRARALLADAREFEDQARRQRENRGALLVGVPAQLTDVVLARIIAAVRAVGPADRVVRVRTSSTVDLVDAVNAGELDCAVVHHPALLHPLECGPVHRIPRFVLVPNGHPSAGAHQPSARMLTDLPFATTPRRHGTAAFDLLEDTLRAKGLDPVFVPAATDREALAEVAAGTAFALTADPELTGPGVTRLALRGDDLALRIRLVWREPGPPAEIRSAIEAALSSEADA